jgi:hypothetical protein
MKNLHVSKGLAALLVGTVMWTSCQKELSQDNSNDLPENFSEQKLSGVIPDDPLAISKVPLIMSSEYFATSDDLSGRSSALRGGKRDIIPPTISITSPASGASVSGTIDVLVNASDNVGVMSVSLSVDGISVISTGTPPFTNSWNSGTVSNGVHTLTVTAMDAKGNKGTSSLQVSVNNVSAGDIISPTVSFITPANQSSVTGTVNVSVNANDNVGVSSVIISIDNIVVSSSTSYSWNTSNFSAGNHTIKAVVKDAAGNQGSSSVIVMINTIIVQPPPASGVQLVMPPVGNQGGEGSCVAFGIGYAARSAEQYYRTNAVSYSNTTNVFSPEFLYNQVKFGSDCGSGTSMQTALDFIMAKGICSYQSMPYSSTNGCSLLPTTTQSSEALNYKISTYSKISILDRTAIKAMISQRHPVIITILADNSFVSARTGFIWKTFSGSGNLPHCIVICGYDDSKNAYKVMNSWGTTWGDAGFSWIDYNFFETGGQIAGNGYCYVIN